MKLITDHATRPKVGELHNGDGVIVRQEGERALFGVVDGLGHGPAAAEVADRAREHLGAVSLELELRRIVEGLHAALRGTRGAAAMICALHQGQLEGCGVGNVELRIQGCNVPVVLSPGVLGGSLRQMRVFSGQLSIGNRLVLFSDGISSRFSLEAIRRMQPGEAAQTVLSTHGHAHDDATILVADLG